MSRRAINILCAALVILAAALFSNGCNKGADTPTARTTGASPRAASTEEQGTSPAKGSTAGSTTKGTLPGTGKGAEVPPQTKDTKPSPAPVAITAAQLSKAFSDDEAAATTKYKDQILVVEGVVDDPNLKEDNGSPKITLTGFEEGYLIDCRAFGPMDREKVAKLSKKQKVKVKGKVLGAVFQGRLVYLSDCAITEAAPDATVAVSAAQLTEEYSKDSEAASAKYKGKPVVVEGIIKTIEFKPGTGVRSVYLEGFNPTDGKPLQVQAEFHSAHENALEKLKVGQKVKLKGECGNLFAGILFVKDVAPVN